MICSFSSKQLGGGEALLRFRLIGIHIRKGVGAVLKSVLPILNGADLAGCSVDSLLRLPGEDSWFTYSFVLWDGEDAYLVGDDEEGRVEVYPINLVSDAGFETGELPQVQDILYFGDEWNGACYLVKLDRRWLDKALENCSARLMSSVDIKGPVQPGCFGKHLLSLRGYLMDKVS